MSNEEYIQQIQETIEGWRDEITDTLKKIIRVPAIAPVNDGEGELKKTEMIEEIIKDWGFDEISRCDAPDEKAAGGIRPNLIAKIWGENRDGPTIWIVTHTDIVPVGDLSLWDTEPFEPLVKDGKLYGRGSEDNGQSLVASMFAAKAILQSCIGNSCR